MIMYTMSFWETPSRPNPGLTAFKFVTCFYGETNRPVLLLLLLKLLRSAPAANAAAVAGGG